MNPDYAGLFLALRPEEFLVLGALVALALDLSAFRHASRDQRLGLALGIASVAVLAAGGQTWVGVRGPVFGGVLILDTLAVATRLAILGLALLTLGVTTGARTPRQPAEYVAVMLFAVTGFMLMAAAQQLLLAFLGLELASLSLYVLAGFDQGRAESAEAGLKYFLFGGIAAAFLLFGFSLVYGVTGSIELREIAEHLSGTRADSLLQVALVMILVGFGFKTAAAPFHLWAPDVYQGAPAPSAALIASGSKLAGFALFVRLFWPGFGAAAGSSSAAIGGVGWLPIVALVAGTSLLLGNFAALAQSNLRRLLAYSAIAHTGALLLGVMAAGGSGYAPLFYYASTYGLSTIGAFGVIGILDRGGRCENVTDLAGLHRRSPLLAGCLAVFILSLAGIPPLAGFFGKFVVFSAALRMGGPAAWLALLAIALSAVALYYYLAVLKQAWVAAAPAEAAPVRVTRAAAFALVAAAALILGLGLDPWILLGRF